MSPEMKRALETATLCSKALSGLKHQATAGDLAALLVLADVATEAAMALEETWRAQGAYNPFQHAKLTSAREIRREAMSFWLQGKSMLPVLHAVDGEPSPNGMAMLNGIRSGPFKPRRRKETDINTLLEVMVIPTFRDIQALTQRPDAIEGRIWDLPPLTSATVNIWSSVIVEWLHFRHRDAVTNPQSWVYRIANPQRGLRADKSKRQRTLKRQLAKWRRQCGGALGPIEATKAEVAAKKIGSMRVTSAHIRNGLITSIVSYLRQNLSA